MGVVTANRLTVVMPVFNEAATLDTVLDDVIRHVLDQVDDSVLAVVDDRSSDSTPEILSAACDRDPRISVIANPVNVGHGRSVRTGFDRSSSEWILHIDSDGQLDLADFARLWELRSDHDLVLGVRTQRNDPNHRLILTRFTRSLASALARHRIADANTPFKLVRRSLFDHLSPSIPETAFAPSILIAIGAHRAGARVAETSITHIARPYGRSTLRLFRLARAAALCAAQTARFSIRRVPPFRSGGPA